MRDRPVPQSHRPLRLRAIRELAVYDRVVAVPDFNARTNS